MEDDDQVIVGFSKCFVVFLTEGRSGDFTVKNACPEQNCSQIRSD
jgi:hypothetical protein